MKKPTYTALAFDLEEKDGLQFSHTTFISVTKRQVEEHSLHTRFGFRILWMLGLLEYRDNPIGKENQ